MTDQRDLKVSVENFGPVREGKFELKPLTIFIGPNNSGKSYTAYLVYSLCRLLSGRGERSFAVPPVFRQLDHFQNYRKDFEEWVRAVYHPGGTGANGWVSADFPQHLQKIFQEAYAKILTASALGEDFKYAVHDYFGCGNIRDLIRSRELNASFSVRLNDFGKSTPLLTIIVESGQENPIVGGKILDISSLRIPIDFIYQEMIREGGDFLIRLVMVSWWALLEASSIPLNVYYLPAARSGIFQGWQTFMSMAVRMLRWRFGLEPIEAPLFTGVVGDFLQLLPEVLLNRQARHLTSMRSALEILEEQVFQGEVFIEKIAQRTPLILYKTGGLLLPLEHTSSMVGELAPLDLWIKYVLNPGDLLIIDEPEAHLHPEAQRRIARVLVRLVRSGVRVFCTTHSSRILHQMSNHLLASEADSEIREDLDFTEADLLWSKEVGVYRFQRQEDGFHIEPVPIEPRFGISEEEFVKVAEDIGEETYRLSLPLRKRVRKKSK